MTAPLPEVWLRGPVPDVRALLHPGAHALLQAREEVEAMMKDFPDDRLWMRPGGVASVGFHLQHLTGVPDRLFTYARGEQLSETQLKVMESEGEPGSGIRSSILVETFRGQVDQAVADLRGIDEQMLTEGRTVGRGRLPSTVLGLLVHSAEHVQRHV